MIRRSSIFCERLLMAATVSSRHAQAADSRLEVTDSRSRQLPRIGGPGQFQAFARVKARRSEWQVKYSESRPSSCRNPYLTVAFDSPLPFWGLTAIKGWQQ